MTVYVVTSGEYDQAGVDGVFSTRAKADEFVRKQSDKYGSAASPWEVEEYVIDALAGDWH